MIFEPLKLGEEEPEAATSTGTEPPPFRLGHEIAR